MAQKVVQDLEHAQRIMRESVDVTWGEAIKHSEPQVIVSAAIICDHFAETVGGLVARCDQLESEVADLRIALDRRGGAR